MEEKLKETAKKFLIYIGIVFLFSIVQMMPELFQIGQSKPNFVVALVIAIAMFEDELMAGVIGMMGGLIWDSSSALVFGMAGAFLLIYCVVCSLLCNYLLRRSLKTSVILIGTGSLVFSFMCYFFLYGMWGYESLRLVFWGQFIPNVLLTIVISPFAFLLVKRISDRLGEPLN